MKFVDPGTNRCCLEDVEKADCQNICVFGSIKVANQLASELDNLWVVVDEFEELDLASIKSVSFAKKMQTIPF